MQLQRWTFGITLAAAILLVAAEQHSLLHGCAPLLKRGEWAGISDEAALIVWDVKTKTEHFVRRANFETNAQDFGFLVPTPTQPDLGEVDDGAYGMFENARNMTKARQVYEKKTKIVFGFGDFPRWGPMPPTMASKFATDEAAVQVLHQQVVAGFDATVLRADDAQALSEWLAEHGYESRPAFTKWLEWYVQNHWIITAFKLTNHEAKPGRRGQPGRLETKSLRMSFRTDQPFYPYREPEETQNGSTGARTLRVYFLSDQKYEGTLGQTGTWPATTKWANDVSKGVGNLTSQLKLTGTDFEESLQGAQYLTEFQDISYPRPGTDEVYFQPAADQATKERPPIVHTRVTVQIWPGPWGLVGIPVLIGVGIGMRRWRRYVNAVCGSELADSSKSTKSN